VEAEVNGSRESAFRGPVVAVESVVKGRVIDACAFGPFGDAEGLAEGGDEAVAAGVAILAFGIGDAEVIGAVAVVIVDAVEGLPLRTGEADGADEGEVGFKGKAPRSKDFDVATTVTMELGMLGIVAAFDHALPPFVFGRNDSVGSVAMGGVDESVGFNDPATARFGVFGLEVTAYDGNTVPAAAGTIPSDISTLGVDGVSADDGESSESEVGEVLEGRHVRWCSRPKVCRWEDVTQPWGRVPRSESIHDAESRGQGGAGTGGCQSSLGIISMIGARCW
jgi:hypothetical protein